MQLTLSIHLHHENGRYLAIVPGHPDCRAYGASYAEALARLERMLQAGMRFGQPDKGSAASAPARTDSAIRLGAQCRSRTIKARLVEKFGRLSNRQLAARIGIVAADAPVMLSSALGGKGSRQVRCAIALALDALPSLLWPEAAARVRAMDDACFLSARSKLDDDASCDAVEHRAGEAYADSPRQ